MAVERTAPRVDQRPIYTYYYEDAGNIVVNLDAAGKLTLTTTNGKIVAKPPGTCS